MRKRLKIFTMFLLLFAFENNSIALSFPVGNIRDKFPYKNNLTRKTDDAIKTAVIGEISEYLNQFNNTCFGQSIRVGEPALFEAALSQKLGTIYVGEEGRQMVAKNTKKGQAYHNSGLLSADIASAFDPRNLAGKAGFFQRQTMMHEITHHIEWLNGVKESSRDWLGNNPRSERNTDYQDNVVNALAGWMRN